MDIYDDAMNMLVNINKINEGPGFFVQVEDVVKGCSYNLKDDKDNKRFNYLLDKILLKEGYVELPKSGVRSPSNNKFQITLKGYEKINALLSKITSSNNVFCAMWFDDETKQAWESSISKAIKNSNFEPKRADEVPYNGICNLQIKKMINECKFVIADLTGLRGGVYYEAGYAHALAKQVIYTCSQKQFDEEKPHFDITLYNFIIWEDLEEFRINLEKTIAVLPI